MLRAALSFSGESAAGTFGARDSGEPGPWHRRLRQPARRRKRRGGGGGGSARLLPRFVATPVAPARGLITVAGSVAHAASSPSLRLLLLNLLLPLTTHHPAGLTCAGGLCVYVLVRACRARRRGTRNDPVVVGVITSPPPSVQCCNMYKLSSPASWGKVCLGDGEVVFLVIQSRVNVRCRLLNFCLFVLVRC